MATSSHEHHDNRVTASNPRAKCYGSGHCSEQTIFHARLSRHSCMHALQLKLTFISLARLRRPDAFHCEVACRSTPCIDSQYPTSMAFHLTFIMAICLLAAERLDHMNGTLNASYACAWLPFAEVFEGLPTGWNFTRHIGFFLASSAHPPGAVLHL
jgi:hypothetical protein